MVINFYKLLGICDGFNEVKIWCVVLWFGLLIWCVYFNCIKNFFVLVDNYGYKVFIFDILVREGRVVVNYVLMFLIFFWKEDNCNYRLFWSFYRKIY